MQARSARSRLREGKALGSANSVDIGAGGPAGVALTNGVAGVAAVPGVAGTSRGTGVGATSAITVVSLRKSKPSCTKAARIGRRMRWSARAIKRQYATTRCTSEHRGPEADPHERRHEA